MAKELTELLWRSNGHTARHDDPYVCGHQNSKIIQKSDFDIRSAQIENNIDYIEKFDTTQGLFIAAALTEYDSNTDIIEEESLVSSHKFVFRE